MTSLVTLSADCEANGHPSECTEPAPGKVEQESSHNVTVSNASGEVKQLATVASANMNFPTHAHGIDEDGNCGDDASHTLDPVPVGLSSSVTINGSAVYLQKLGVQSDPKTGDNIDIINSGVNNSVTESP